MILKKKVLIAGQNGMVGSAIYNVLKKEKIYKIIECPRKKLDFTNIYQVERFFKKNKPNFVINCAGRVGGILDNSSYQNDEINGGRYYQPYNGNNNFLAAGAGVVIPFGNQLADSDCRTVLAFVEGEGYISILTGLQKLGVLDDAQIKTLGSKFLNDLHGKLGLDPEDFTQQIKPNSQSK